MPEEGHAHDVPSLARRAGAGDRDAFRLLVEATHVTVYRIALRTLDDPGDAEDVVQETFARAWRSLGKLEEPAAVVGWLCRIARNAATDRVRARRSRPAPVRGDDAHAIAERLASPEPLADDVLASAQTRAFVREVVATLDEKFRTVLLMCEVDGMTANEVSLALGVPVGTVESRLSRGRAMLAQKIERAARRERRWFPW